MLISHGTVPLRELRELSREALEKYLPKLFLPGVSQPGWLFEQHTYMHAPCSKLNVTD